VILPGHTQQHDLLRLWQFLNSVNMTDTTFIPDYLKPALERLAAAREAHLEQARRLEGTFQLIGQQGAPGTESSAPGAGIAAVVLLQRRFLLLYP
jgi:hypothetical protein